MPTFKKKTAGLRDRAEPDSLRLRPSPMPHPFLLRSFALVGFFLTLTVARAADPVPGTASTATPPRTSWTDEQGRPYRRASTGHITNYDEARVGSYVLPDPLVSGAGVRVTNPETWRNQRRSEIVEFYRKEIYGRVPATPPRVSFETVETDAHALRDTATHKVFRITFEAPGKDPVQLNVHLYLPKAKEAPAPVILHLLFGSPPDLSQGTTPAPGAKAFEIGPVTDFLDRGYAYCIFRYTEIEPDSAKPTSLGIRALVPSDPAATGEAWGTIAAWAWGASRVLDCLAREPAVDATRVALVGHSRLGKTVLWGGAQDERFSLVFSSCAGEMGSALARRDYGETVDDMAGNFAHQFAPNFRNYANRWNDMPVDAHFLIAAIAPRPVLITGGTQDQWADPRGEFLAESAAAPVYRLLGKTDLGTSKMPPPDSPLIAGDLAFYYHTGGHSITADDWKVFLEFADRHLGTKHP